MRGMLLCCRPSPVSKVGCGELSSTPECRFGRKSGRHSSQGKKIRTAGPQLWRGILGHGGGARGKRRDKPRRLARQSLGTRNIAKQGPLGWEPPTGSLLATRARGGLWRPSVPATLTSGARSPAQSHEQCAAICVGPALLLDLPKERPRARDAPARAAWKSLA